MQKIIDKLGLTKEALKIETGTEKIDGEYIIFTYITGKGKTPTAVEKFLVANPNVKAVVGSGRRAKSHIETFNFATNNISKTYNIPIIAKLDGVGTDEDIELIRKKLLEF